MLHLITATPGSGKTLFAIQKIYEHLNKGHVVFSNIAGLKIPGVFAIETNTDWRDLDHFKRLQPEFSHKPIAVFYDEAHEHPAFDAEDTQYKENGQVDRLKQKEVRDQARALRMHRHFGFDIYLITQQVQFIESVTVGLCGIHWHLHRAFGLQRSTLYMWRSGQTNPTTRSVQRYAEEKTTFKFPKHFYDLYDSATVHTHKARIPLYYVGVVLLPIALFSYSGYTYYKSHYQKETPLQASETQEQTLSPTLQQLKDEKEGKKPNEDTQQKEQVLIDDEKQRVASVFASSDSCRAYNGFGDLVQISVQECLDYADHPAKLRATSDTFRQQRLSAVNYTQYTTETSQTAETTNSSL
ncbi:zonular occludens toxin domain-containing protein [Acinetobacter tjernbergiae]|uniref:Zona occludens toxin N-terminal domain-containing protein n=1 Tax=Acinetobacter tjernbergiae DSM 14971 = CIP 107465 TaxID=1120928 RepID=V2UPH4_9GAMM|nr:zonular occludens toxin domain-containing protein [Acinetobacter tjernbergiae]ESK51862.1 hypothetical protein F990_03532 [Acinetobacter tjernbergiae DSM 14971 = CIP 107465]